MSLEWFNKYKLHLIWVILLLLFSISWGFYNFNKSNSLKFQSQQELTVRVLELNNSSSFSYIYTVNNNGSFYKLLSNTSLKIGEIVSIKADSIELFGKDSLEYKSYLYTTGIKGQIITKTKPLSRECDFYCKLVKFRSNVLGFSYQKFSNITCYEFVDLFSSLEKINCVDSASLATGLIFGNIDQMTKDTKKNLTNLGLSHIIAVSGFQIVVIIAFIEKLLESTVLNKNLKLILIILFCTCFTLIVGLEPPIVRALFSFLVSAFSLQILGRKAPFYLRLIYSFVLIAIFFPTWIFSFSLQLSYLATIAVSLTPFNLENNYNLKNIVKDSFYSSVLSFLITFPLILSISNQINLLSIVLSAIISAFIPYLTALLIIGYLITPVALIALFFIQMIIVTSNYLDFGIYFNFEMNQFEALVLSSLLILLIFIGKKTKFETLSNSFLFIKNIFNLSWRKPNNKV